MLAGCDLQPKIVALPETISDFISSRYPAMLADPVTQPEIYNSAAADYGMYSSPDLYGSPNIDDYVQYESPADYVLKDMSKKTTAVAVRSAEPLPQDYLSVPRREIKTNEITVAAGETLYSLSRRYEVPVNDLAVLNNISAPFTLGVGQKLKVPDKVLALPKPPVQIYGTEKTPVAAAPVVTTTPAPKTETSRRSGRRRPAQTIEETPKVSSVPAKPLPKIAARTSSKFSWPVRGKILSSYGSKTNGLFNDGINIAAKTGTSVGAAENGVVAYAGNEVKGMGNLIIVQHSDGWMTVYAHLDSMAVRRGVKVKVGQKLGTVGGTGKVSEPQLHFEIRKGTKAYDPVAQLKK